MATIPRTMRAVVCETTGPISVLQVKDVPVPVPQAGQVLIKILGFGINRAEMFTRQGFSPSVKFPRVIGIECIGTVAASPSPSSFALGSRVATCMGGMGREFDGSYAEYTCVPQENVRALPPTKNLSVAQLAALPEMMQTTWGALTAGLDVQPGESVLIRGATSSIGLCAIQLCRHKLGASRIGATSRSVARADMLLAGGADEVFVDQKDPPVSAQVQASPKGGFDKVLELNGTTTLLDSVKCAVTRGTVSMTGIQGGQWSLDGFQPMEDLPNRVRLSGYGGGAEDFHTLPLEDIVREVDEGRIKIPVRAFRGLDEIQEAHKIMESGGGGAKMVVVVADE